MNFIIQAILVIDRTREGDRTFSLIKFNMFLGVVLFKELSWSDSYIS